MNSLYNLLYIFIFYFFYLGIFLCLYSMSEVYGKMPVRTVKLTTAVPYSISTGKVATMLCKWAVISWRCCQALVSRTCSGLKNKEPKSQLPVTCAVPAKRGPVMYIANEIPAKDCVLLYIAPFLFQLIDCVKIVHVCNSNFPNYCIKNKIALNKKMK